MAKLNDGLEEPLVQDIKPTETRVIIGVIGHF